MIFTTFRRVLHFGLINFWRTRWVALASILVLTLTLITITISIIQNMDVRQTIESVKDRLDMVVYFDDKVSEVEIQDLQLKLESRSDVKSIKYVSKNDALLIWQQRPTSRKIKELVTPDNNPLPRSLVIKTDDPQSLETIASLLEAPTYNEKIRRISYQDNKKIITDLIDKNNSIRRTGLISSATFVIISLIVIINTMRIIILTRKEEIEIMRLVGASDIYIRAPFLVEAILTAILAALLTTAFIAIGLSFKLQIIPFFFSLYFDESSFLTIRQLIISNLPIIFVLQLMFAFTLTITTTFISMRRYLTR